jgi:hypothetical protein
MALKVEGVVDRGTHAEKAPGLTLTFADPPRVTSDATHLGAELEDPMGRAAKRWQLRRCI